MREADYREQACGGIDPIANEAVVAAVGGIEELAGRMDRDFGRAVRSVVPAGSVEMVCSTLPICPVTGS